MPVYKKIGSQSESKVKKQINVKETLALLKHSGTD
jgi:hypothetical protein